MDHEERQQGICSKTQILSGIFLRSLTIWMQKAVKFLAAHFDLIYHFYQLCNTRLLAFHPMHSIHNSPVCRWISIHAFCTPIATRSMTCMKCLISQGLHHGSNAIFKQLAPTNPSKNQLTPEKQESTLYHRTLTEQARQHHCKYPSKCRNGDQHT